jgi:hypothetical protein
MQPVCTREQAFSKKGQIFIIQIFKLADEEEEEERRRSAIIVFFYPNDSATEMITVVFLSLYDMK